MTSSSLQRHMYMHTCKLILYYVLASYVRALSSSLIKTINDKDDPMNMEEVIGRLF